MNGGVISLQKRRSLRPTISQEPRKRRPWRMVPEPLLWAWNSPRARTENATNLEPKCHLPTTQRASSGSRWPWLSGKLPGVNPSE